MAVYLGTSLVLGTSSGVRIGKVSEAGDVQYGPLTVATPSPVQDVTFRDSFAYLSVSAGLPGGVSGAVRVDLSAEIEETGRFAYAWDAHTDSIGTATSIALVGSSVVLACDNHVFIQSATDFVSEGWLDTGRIRFGTVEPKAFRLIRTVVATNGGTAAVRVLTPDGVEHRVVDFTDDFQQDSDVAIQIPGRPVTQYVSFRLYLRPSTADTSPVISALSVKAVPASSRVRLYQYPLACFDQETDGNGQRFATEGGAYVRLSALETLEETSEPILIADNRVGETFVGQIDSVNFTATTPPDRARGNFGGLAVVQVRRL
jgi:hypothetical protein